MAPNKRGAAPGPQPRPITIDPPSAAAAATPAAPYDYASGDGSGMVSKAEVEARGKGTREDSDSYDIKNFWHCEKRVFLTGLMFLTRIPCPGWCDHHPAFLMRSLQWFPVIGAIVGT